MTGLSLRPSSVYRPNFSEIIFFFCVRILNVFIQCWLSWLYAFYTPCVVSSVKHELKHRAHMCESSNWSYHVMFFVCVLKRFASTYEPTFASGTMFKPFLFCLSMRQMAYSSFPHRTSITLFIFDVANERNQKKKFCWTYARSSLNTEKMLVRNASSERPFFNKHIKHVTRGETNSSVCAVPCACGCIQNVEYKMKRQSDARVSMQNVHVMTEWWVVRRKNIPSNFLWRPEQHTATATPWHRRLFSVQSFSSLNFVLRSHHFTLYGCRTIFSYFLMPFAISWTSFFSINECMRHAISKCVCSNGTVGVMVVVVRYNCGSGTTSSYNIHYRRI